MVLYEYGVAYRCESLYLSLPISGFVFIPHSVIAGVLTSYLLPQHCAYSWRKLARAPATGVTVDRRSSGLDHIAHCEMNFLRREDAGRVMTRAAVSLDADETETRHRFEEGYDVVVIGGGLE